MRPRLLDLFCGAGGAAMGYHRAGFEVVGVDHKPQKHYPFEFHQADALEFCREHGREYDAIHASPPCQAHSSISKQHGSPRLRGHISLIDAIRRLLGPAWSRCRCGNYWCGPHWMHAHECPCPPIEEWETSPYSQPRTPTVIENVNGSPLKRGSLVLCGSMFGLGVQRHRIFECSVLVMKPGPCRHNGHVIGVYGNAGGKSRRDGIKFGSVAEWRAAMGIDWMNGRELAQAIPPAYTEFIGKQLLRTIGGNNGN